MNMSKIYHKLLSSFSMRISLYILSVATIVFIVTFAITLHYARHSVKDEAIKHAMALVEKNSLQIDYTLESIEDAVRNSSWLVTENVDNPGYMHKITEMLLLENPHLYASSIAFEPFYYAEKGKYWAPFAMRNGAKITNMCLGNDEYNYHNMEWYQGAKQIGKPNWSEPYFDKGGGETIMTTYSFPIFKDGKLIAVFTADLSLEQFDKKVKSIYPNFESFMIDRNGTFIVHSNVNAILRENIFENASKKNMPKLTEIAQNMTAGKVGLFEDDEKYYFYAPIPSTKWSVAIACHPSVLYSSIDHLSTIAFLITAIGLFLMTGLCYYAIKKISHPLTAFAKSAQEIASGTFNAPLPQIATHDEMKTLHDSFASMQQSLVNHIEQLRTTTANKERIDSELRIARNIQMDMIPKDFPPFPNRNDIELYAILKPAKEIGGDLYDYFIKDEKLYFIVGDVSGKGVPASLIMAVTCRLFRTIALQNDNPKVIATVLNKILSYNNDSNMFCTAFIGVLNLQTEELHYCNAGHNAPISISKQSCKLDVIPNLPLGLFDDFTFQEQCCKVEHGSALLLYTDGVTEAENRDNKLYTDEHLIAKLNNVSDKSAEEIVKLITNDVAVFSGEAEQSDDITVLCIKYNKPLTHTIVFKNDINDIGKLPEFLEKLAATTSISDEISFKINLALEEAIVNVMQYAYPEGTKGVITLKATVSTTNIEFVLTDNGQEFDPTTIANTDTSLSAEEREIGGLGIYLTRQIMDSVEYKRIENQNILILKKTI